MDGIQELLKRGGGRWKGKVNKNGGLSGPIRRSLSAFDQGKEREGGVMYSCGGVSNNVEVGWKGNWYTRWRGQRSAGKGKFTNVKGRKAVEHLISKGKE